MSEKERLLKLAEEAKNCVRCRLYKTRKNVVFGDGPLDSPIMLIGEAPGYWEDLKGKPFVGAAGKFLDKLLALAGLDRGKVYITNVVKCRPPGNREPKPDEVEACRPYLEEQINLIKPKIICTLGNVASTYLLQKFGFRVQPMGRIHGKVFEVNQLKIIPLYHPATALYKPPIKTVLEEDWMLLKARLEHLAT
ncbi:MAG: uracil-DNA glycosylase [Candidatus Hecatellales archaeon]|nr:MAG: uracil-DNA glycosylase [Candidatus Hecatellales archaeon]